MIRIAFIALVLGTTAFAAMTPQGDLTLADGRVAINARPIGVNINKQTIQIRADNLPSSEVVLIPYSAAPESWQAWIIEKAGEKRQRQAETQKKVSDIRARQEAERERSEAEHNLNNPKPKQVDAPSPMQAALVAEEARKLRQEKDLARSRDGLLLAGFPARTGGLYLVQITNAHDNPRLLDWRQLHALTLAGEIVPARDVRFAVTEVAGYDVDGRATRNFQVDFQPGEIVAVGWADRPDLGWVDHQGATVTADVALAAAKAKAIERARQRNARGLTPVEGQLVRN